MNQMVIQGKNFSNTKNIKIGVPQGSVLGPFLVHSRNKLFHILLWYADDATFKIQQYPICVSYQSVLHWPFYCRLVHADMLATVDLYLFAMY